MDLRLCLNGINYDNAQLRSYCERQISSAGTPKWMADLCSFILEFTDENDSIIVNTSGSTANSKNIILKKKYMIQSALNTADALGMKRGDNALLCISPNFIGGKMMIVRAMVLGLKLIAMEPTSNPVKSCSSEIDFAAMVPMQIGTILQDDASTSKLKKIRNLIIGGGKIDQRMANQLRSFPNNIYETYGMTESCSHIALKRINGNNPDKYFKTMAGVEISKDEKGCLVIAAPQVSENEIITNDLVEIIDDQSFEILGRFDNIINSGGVKLNPETIENKLTSIIDSDFFIASLPDQLLGEKVILVIKGSEDENVKESALYPLLKARLEVFELPKEIYYCQNFHYTETSKINRHLTLAELKDCQ